MSNMTQTQEIGTTIHDEPVVVRRVQGFYRVEIDTVRVGPAFRHQIDAAGFAEKYVPAHRRSA